MSYTIPDSVLAQQLGESTIVLQAEEGMYYELNETGTLIWEALKAGQSQEEIHKTLCTTFEIDLEQAHSDTDELIQDLLKHQLLRASHS